MSQFPRIIFGTSTLGNLYSQFTDSEKYAVIAEVLKANAHARSDRTNNDSQNDCLVMFDSAGKYGAGLALETLGRILHDLNIPSERVIISNKLGWKRIPLNSTGIPTFESDIWKNLNYDAAQSISYNGILECYEQGNDLLRSYKVNAVSIHDPDEYLGIANLSNDVDLYYKRKQDIFDAYRALQELKQDKKVHSIGVGSKDIDTIEMIANETQLDWIMIACSYTIYNHPKRVKNIMKKLRDKGIQIINSAVFNSGFLVGGEYYNYEKVTLETHPNLFSWRDEFFRVCEIYNITPVAACIQFSFLFSDNCVSSVALNPCNPNNVKEYYEALQSNIPEKFWDELRIKNLISVEPSLR